MEESNSNNSVDMSNLTSAIVQCFSIILIGYFAGRTGVITPIHGAGIGKFVSRFCLPALIFKSMCELNFSSVNWLFLLGIFLAKSCVFVLVIVATLVIKRPLDLGLAGIFGIFVSQSNDFAFGYPIVEAIYKNSHPDFVKYLYLMAPMSFLFYNPIGYFMMEIQRHKNEQIKEHDGIGHVICKVLKSIVMNPLLNMSIIGIVANFILGGHIPGIVDPIFTVLGQAFKASALFFLGLSLVGKIQGKMDERLLVPFLIVIVKILLLPLFAWGILQRLECEQNSTSFSMYGFLYGTIPTTPSVYIFATEFGFGGDIIATALVMGTALSAPFMFVSAKMMTLIVEKSTEFKDILYTTSYDVSIVSLIGSVWVAGLFIFTGKVKRIPHRFTLAYIISHIISCIGMIAYYNVPDKTSWRIYPSQICLMVGVLATRMWTAILSVVLCVLHVRSLCAVLRLQSVFYFVGFGFPMVLTGILFIVGDSDINSEINPSFHYGKNQAIFSLVVLLISTTVTVGSLLWWQREERHHHTIQTRARYAEIPASSHRNVAAGSTPEHAAYKTVNQAPLTKAPSLEDIIPFIESKEDEEDSYAELASNNFEDSIMDHVSERICLLGQCSPEQRHECLNHVRHYTRHSINVDVTPMEEVANVSIGKEMMREYQSGHHLVLLLPLVLSMFVAIFLCTWKLFKSQATGIYIEIEFLDLFLNYGQGILIALVFGFESKIIFSPVLRRLRRTVFGSEIMRLPLVAELDKETTQICNQFTKYHKENCLKEIVRDRRFRGQTISSVFTGTSMCDWLIRCGLAVDRSTAVEYGCHLILGRVITHITSEQNFHDTLYFYKFMDTYEQLPV